MGNDLMNVLYLVSVSSQVTMILSGRMWPDSSHTPYKLHVCMDHLAAFA
jgi:hypothetical protein